MYPDHEGIPHKTRFGAYLFSMVHNDIFNIIPYSSLIYLYCFSCDVVLCLQKGLSVFMSVWRCKSSVNLSRFF